MSGIVIARALRGLDAFARKTERAERGGEPLGAARKGGAGRRAQRLCGAEERSVSKVALAQRGTARTV